MPPINFTLTRRPVICAIACAIVCVGCNQPDADKNNDRSPPTQSTLQQASESQSPSGIEGLTNNAPAIDSMEDRSRLIEKAEAELQSGNLSAAEATLKTALVSNPDDVEIIFRLASTVAQTGNLGDAIDYMSEIPEDHPEAGLPALGQSADWCLSLGRYDDAEAKYHRIIELIPDAAEAHRQLAYLYNRQGRRQEAARHLQTLCLLGNVLQDELHGLIHLSDAMYDPVEKETVPEDLAEQNHATDRRYWPIGSLAEARKDFSNHAYQAAADRLKKQLPSGPSQPAAIALLGRAAAEAQDEEGVLTWLKMSGDDAESFSDHWAALGLVLLQENKLDQAGRAFLEALSRDPTDFRTISRLRSILEATGDSPHALLIEERFQALKLISQENNQVVDSSTPNTEAMLQLANRLQAIDRKSEAALWRLLAGFRQNLSQAQMTKIQSDLKQVLESGGGFPDTNSNLCGIKTESFPLPDLATLRNEIAEREPTSKDTLQSIEAQPEFVNISRAAGLQHAYRIAQEPQDSGFSVYQSVGGAVVVLDFDNDGSQDLYFCQGAANPPDFISTSSNELYRNVNQKVTEVASASATNLKQYSLGATSGDWNQDGLPDLVVSNIGSNILLINNGDGTFQSKKIDDRDDKTLMSTSLAMADLNGDQLPDLFEVNYLHDQNLAKRPRRNEAGEVVETLMPKDFESAFDRVLLQHGDGSIDFQTLNQRPSDARAGLGIIVGDFNHKVGNEIFVGNDVDANQLWSWDTNSQTWQDSAMLLGCAYGFSGAKTASMGIASGDFDGNGWLDLHITNFQGESVSHYLNSAGTFRDRNIQYGLAEPSQSVLGFGAQSIDFDLDGDLDLAVVNGHIENSISTRQIYRQPAQLFTNLGTELKLIEVKDPSDYWSQKHVGRGLARLDWNQDGKPDLIVTHQSEPSALLINETKITHHWIHIEVRGTESERDAIGTRIEVQLKDDQVVHWVTAGDGFLCRNQSAALLGLGNNDEISKIIVHWPSGTTQEFPATDAVDRRILLIENQTDPFQF